MDSYSPKAIGAAIFAVIVVILGIFFIAASTYEAVPPDKVALHYTGGPVQGTHFVSVVQPGTGAHDYGLFEHLYMLPATQRTYIISKTIDAGDQKGSDFISAPSKDRVPFTYEAAAYFKLNTAPAVLRDFFESICLHDKCYNDDGWNKMLGQFFRPQLEFAIAQEAKKYDKAKIYSDPATLAAMNAAISQNLKDDINSNLGGPFFCGPDSTVIHGRTHCTDFKVVLKSPTPPKDITDAYTKQAAAQQNQQIAANQGDADITKAQKEAQAAADRATGEANSQRIRAGAPPLSQQQLDYIRAQAEMACASNPSCTLIVSGTGTGVNVNTGK